jgi:hypothetical protein
MTIYNLFRNVERPELLCAVPEDRPVPAFTRGPQWEYGRRIDTLEADRLRFNRQAADASVRYNGFYLFQVILTPDLRPRPDHGSARDVVPALPSRLQRGREFPRVADPALAAAEPRVLRVERRGMPPPEGAHCEARR